MAMNSANDAMSGEAPIRLPKTGEVVAERLRRQIARGELTIGQRLPPEDELTAVFGIARTTLREALRILESQGLVEIRRGRTGGPVVTMPKIDSLAEGLAVTLQLQGTTAGDLDVARQLIEPRLAARLATHHTADDLDALHAAVDRASVAADAVDQVAFGAAAAAMHDDDHGTRGQQHPGDVLAPPPRVGGAVLRTLRRHDRPRADAARGAVVPEVGAAHRRGRRGAAEEHWRKQMTFTIEGWHRDQRVDLFEP